MMNTMLLAGPSPDAPIQVRIGRDPHASVYVLEEDYYALHGVAESPMKGSPILVLEDGAVAVFRGHPRDPEPRTPGRTPPPHIGPVYALAPGGTLAVPTGRILVRFSPGTLAEEHRTALRGVGFEIEEVLAYAPEAAWLRPATGGIGVALRRIPALEAMQGVDHVEPQMLMQTSRRTPRRGPHQS